MAVASQFNEHVAFLSVKVLNDVVRLMGWLNWKACSEDRECIAKMADIIRTSVELEIEQDRGLRYEELHRAAYNDLADLWR